MTVKAHIYFHIHNGGVTLAVEDRGDGPVVSMEAVHFSHQTGRSCVGVRKQDLKAIGEMFLHAAGLDYSPDSREAADYRPIEPTP